MAALLRRPPTTVPAFSSSLSFPRRRLWSPCPTSNGGARLQTEKWILARRRLHRRCKPPTCWPWRWWRPAASGRVDLARRRCLARHWWQAADRVEEAMGRREGATCGSPAGGGGGALD
ncbi:hypothetical protein PR202_ga20177 [Eleusine coracana subsp. coracana]|uniref:Uncharacterized protein n=1 Tax=Eleusine coracana subsp. coracana TaxID=191504 RepID=A0AAV5CXC2_ELECO|nr:hypothetical protein PR202_ga20177 [Eleusine coracana subsp. coracana]